MSFCRIFVIKMLFQISLLVIFIFFFGIPSVERFIDKEVLTVTTETYPDKIPLPAVTVTTSDASDGGWEALEMVCVESKDIKSCIQENTRSLQDTGHAELGFTLRESLMAPQMWREDFTRSFYGRSYTLVYPHLRGINWKTDAINLHVNTSDNLTRRIYIHDPEYFLLNSNPQALPITRLTLAPRSGRVFFSFTLTEHRKLDTQNNPCMEDPDYSFTSCVKESVSRKHGCRLPWDILSDQKRPECSTMQQYQAIVRDFDYLESASSREIFTKTGCIKPCNYREYVMIQGSRESVLIAYSYFSVDLWMASTDITILTEIPVYPWTSLMAEFGGTFSLFFGLSMMTLWDGMEKLTQIIKLF